MSKRMKDLKSKVDKNNTYSLDEALALVKETSTVKFDATVEVHVKLGIDPKKGDQQIRSTVVLPHGTGKTKRVAAFVGPNNEQAAKDAGADLICGEDEIKQINETKKIDFDIAIATPDMMPKIAMVAKVLGPRGLMPNPKTDTVGTDIAKMIKEQKGGKVTLKNDETANLHMAVGKISFSDEQLKENIMTLLDSLKKAKPMSSKGALIKGLYLTSSMGPSVKMAIPQ